MLLSLPETGRSFTLLPALQYGTVPGATAWSSALHLDMLIPSPVPEKPAPVVIYLHGGGWAEGERSTALYPWLNPFLAVHGFVTVSVTYRLSRFAAFPAQLYDVKAAVRWLRAHATEYHLDPERIGVWGDSAGGHLAALLGLTADLPAFEGNCGSPEASSRVQAVIARCTPFDLLYDVGPALENVPPAIMQLFQGSGVERAEQMRQGSPITHVKPGAPPFQVVHGTLDSTVPFAPAEEFVAALKAAGNEVEFLVIPGVYHNLRSEEFLPWSDTPWQELAGTALTFFQRHLLSERA